MNEQLRLLPTTTAADAKASGGAEGSANVTLTDAIIRGRGLLPTPRATDGTKGGPNQRGSSGDLMLPSAVQTLLPTPRTSDTNGAGRHGTGGADLRTAVAGTLLPTPRATRGGSGTETMYNLGAERSDNSRPQGEVLLQTPSVADGLGGHLTRSGSRSNEKLLPGQAKELATDWGPYAPAIHRWERVLGRPAPAPTEPNSRGGHRLSPKFTEWMMGVPEGWITDVPISRNEQLKACGNGVVPQQAAAALKDMLKETR